ncbi:MAG TPA: glycosyltransferase, partial [Candidatus Aquilonibacter sp.]|nr:glycosyltransferase [Candidatus Aquilonibacter sp.]
GEILERLAHEHPRLRVIHGEALPDGWIGKPWALMQGADVARGEWLLFTDADTLHEPGACASAVTHARRHAVSFLSLLPTQIFETAGERILLPTILWMIAFGVGSLEAINDPERLDAAIFNGQYLLVERAAYDAIGGHAAVRDRIAEDYALAQIVKNDGRFHSRLAGASDLVFTRMYRSAREVWDGFSKNLYVAAENKPAQAVVGSIALAAISPLPSLLLLHALKHGERKRALRMGVTILATSLTAEAGMRHSRFPRGSGLFFPIGIAAMLGIFLNSALAHRTGRVSWRGRRYPRRTT